MLTIVDLGHKPSSCCYLIELDVYPRSDHKAFRILVDAPIEMNEILDFVPNGMPSSLRFGSQHKAKWKRDESGKDWLFGNKRFKASPFYFSAPFKETKIKKQDESSANCKPPESTKRKLSSSPQCALFDEGEVFVDIVLISNHESILALPFLIDECEHSLYDDFENMDNEQNMRNLLDSLLSTEPVSAKHILQSDADCNKKEKKSKKMGTDSICIRMAPHCKIYATEPSKEFGKLMMESMACSNDEYFSANGCKSNGKMYQMEQIKACIDRIICVEHNESFPVFCCNELEIICLSSGLFIGSSNWIIKGDAIDISIALIMASCGATNRHSRSIALAQLIRCDVVLIDDLQSTSLNDESANDLLQRMESKIKETISPQNRGTVIMPTSSCGLCFDILERIHFISDVQIFFVSAIAARAVSYCSIFGQYLHQNMMNKVTEAQCPFASFKNLVICRNWNSDFCAKHIKSNLNEPRIIICDHSSMRFGNVLHLISVFNHSQNALILTDPRIDSHSVLLPFSDALKMQISSFPIDGRLQVKEACVLLRKCCPKYAFVPSSHYLQIHKNMQNFVEMNAQKNVALEILQKIKKIKYFAMSSGVHHRLCIKSEKKKKILIDPLISRHIYPKNMNPNHSSSLFVASVCGKLDFKNDANKLLLTTKDFIAHKCVVNKTFVGALNVDSITKSPPQFFKSIRKENENEIVIQIDKKKSIQVTTSQNETRIRSDFALNKQTLTRVLDLISLHLTSL